MNRFVSHAAARLGFSWDSLDVTRAALYVETPPLLVIHDRFDGEASWRDGAAIAGAWPGAALDTTTGLGHRRILADPNVIERAVSFISGDASLAAR